MYLSAFLHREQLFEITNRWLSDRPKPSDGLKIKRIIAFDSFAAWETMLQFIETLIPHLFPCAVKKKALFHKRELKDFLCSNRHPQTDRTNTLVEQYRLMPEYFYVGSPIVGYIFHDSTDAIKGICRFKRIKRIAEKASRYAGQFVFNEILKPSGKQSTQNPVGFTDFKDCPISPEFLSELEKTAMTRIRADGLALPANSVTIDDILGVKIVEDNTSEYSLEGTIEKIPNARILDKENHSGNYHAIHYLVELSADFKTICRLFSQNTNYRESIRKRIPLENLEEEFSRFVSSGEKTIHLELILTTFEDLLESEIGRSMHEGRIFQQRLQQRLYGNIPLNIEYIIEYLFAVGMSPTNQVTELPIKLWGRYLPDSIGYQIRKLYQMPESALIDKS